MVCNIAKELYHELLGNRETVPHKILQSRTRHLHSRIIKGNPKGRIINRVIYHSFQNNEEHIKIHLLETKYMKIAHRGLNIELRKKFKVWFKDFYELVAKVMEYEELLREESQRRRTSMGTYY